MLLNVFCFLFLFRLFCFFVEMCNRNTNCHCTFTRTQSARKACIRLGIEILWLVWCNNDALRVINPRVNSLVNLKFITVALDVLQHYYRKYSLTYANIFWGYHFQQEVWKQKLEGTQKAVIVIFKEKLQTSTEMYSEHSQISKMELFVKMVNRLKPIFNYALRKLCHRRLNKL